MNTKSKANIFLTFMTMFTLTFCVTNPYFLFPYSDTTFNCSSFCMYKPDGAGNLLPMCTTDFGGRNGNGFCKDCD